MMADQRVDCDGMWKADTLMWDIGVEGCGGCVVGAKRMFASVIAFICHATRCGGIPIPTMCHPARESKVAAGKLGLALTSDISEGGHAQLPSVITPLVIWIERQ
jgi:hypothetical protein